MIDKATINDLKEILQLQKAAFQPIADKMNDPSIPPLLQSMESLTEEWNKGIILTYRTDNKIVGSVRGYLDPDNHCQVGKLIVHPNYQKRGIGKALMLEIEKHFPKCDAFKLFTGLITPNTAYLYKQLGYKELYTDRKDNIPMVFMEKKSAG